MMDPSAEITQRVDPIPDLPRVDGKRPRTDPVSKVLGDDNLLIEIILRLGFPTTLVRVALVCKRWLEHASDPAILGRFRKLHPPRLLGFYISNMLDLDKNPPLFVTMQPQPLELEAIIRRANFSLGTHKSTRKIHIVDCRNSNVFIRLYDSKISTFAEAVHTPLFPDSGMSILPQLPPRQPLHGGFCTLSDFVFKEEGDNLPYLYVWVESTGGLTKSTVHAYMLQDGVWCILTSITITHIYFVPRVLRPLLADNKIYMASLNNILVLDLLPSSFSLIQLPQGAGYYDVGNSMLSRVDDDTGIYLIHANELQLRIWLHKWEEWLLVDTICLREMLASLSMSDDTFGDDHNDVVLINQVGKNVEFVFLQMGRSILYLDIKCRTLRKVYGVARDGVLHHIHPFMMIWPPTLPSRKDDPTRFVFCPLVAATNICIHVLIVEVVYSI